MTASLDPFRRILEATRLDPPLVVDGVSYALALRARPVGDHLPASIVTARVAGSEPITGGHRVWFDRAPQYSSQLVVNGPGDAVQKEVAHNMGGNVCTTPEPMRLAFHNNGEAFTGGDHGQRTRPWDVLELEHAGGKRRFLVTATRAHGKAPSAVNYAPTTAVETRLTHADDRLLHLDSLLGEALGVAEELLIDDGELLGTDRELLFPLIGVLFQSAPGVWSPMTRTQFTATGAPVVEPYTGAVEGYYPDDADFGAPGTGRYFWDRAARTLRFNDGARAIANPGGISVGGFRTSAAAGQFYSYIWPGDDASVLDMTLEGAGTGLDAEGGDHRVARAVEVWADHEFEAVVEIGHVAAPEGFGKAGVFAANGVRAGARMIAVDWHGGTPRVYTIDEEGDLTHLATWPSSVPGDEPWGVGIVRWGASSWTVEFYPPGGEPKIVVATFDFDLGADAVTFGLYAAEEARIRWRQGADTLGPARGYVHVRDAMVDDQPSRLGVRVAAIDATHAFARRELTMPTETLASLVNVTAGNGLMARDGADAPSTRLSYGWQGGAPPRLILPLEAAGDTFLATFIAPGEPPAAPGEFPPAQGRLNFSTPGGSVAQNRANYHDYVEIEDPLEEWPGAAATGGTASFRRDGVWRAVDAVEWAVVTGGVPSWSPVAAEDRRVYPTDGLVLVAASWVAANLTGGRRLAFRVTGEELQRTGRFDATSANLLAACFESLEDAWVSLGGAGGSAGPLIYCGTIDYALGPTGYDVQANVATPTDMKFGTRSGTLLQLDPEVEDDSLDSCGEPARTLDPGPWDRSLWPTFRLFGETVEGWAGATHDGLDEGTRVVGTTTPGGDPVSVCTHDLTIEDAIGWEARRDVVPPVFFMECWPGGGGANPNELAASCFIAGLGIPFSERLARFPDGTTCLEAKAEVTVPADVVIETLQVTRHFAFVGKPGSLGTFGYRQEYNGALLAEYWETYDPGEGTWSVTTPAATYPPAPPPSEFQMAWVLYGTRRKTRVVTVPEKGTGGTPEGVGWDGHEYVPLGATLPAAVGATGEAQIMDVTRIVTALLAARGSDLAADGFFLWPALAGWPSPEEVAREGFYAGLLRAMIPAMGVEFVREGPSYGAKVTSGLFQRVTMPTLPGLVSIFARLRLPGGVLEELEVPVVRAPLVRPS